MGCVRGVVPFTLPNALLKERREVAGEEMWEQGACGVGRHAWYVCGAVCMQEAAGRGWGQQEC